MFGYSADEMLGQPILRLIPEELRYEEDEILRKIRTGERIEHYETTRTKKNGDALNVSVTISPIRDQSGKIIGASKIARDISNRKRIERLLVQSEKLAATGRMAATIAHEINNPLESLVNLIYLARKDSGPDGKVGEYLVTAESELERLSHIARQTLGFYDAMISTSETMKIVTDRKALIIIITSGVDTFRKANLRRRARRRTRLWQTCLGPNLRDAAKNYTKAGPTRRSRGLVATVPMLPIRPKMHHMTVYDAPAIC
jgi:PAS domain S-box-containing protein